jgi:DNA-directed RNA polymerase subunit alpha
MRIRWRGLELPSKVTCNPETLTNTYGEFVVVPFERGFGHTVGNSLRRILLSSLEGSAVTSIKIKGALHEFTSLKGVLEDVTEVVLNVKSLVVRLREDRPKVLRLTKNSMGAVTSDDITPDQGIEVISKGHHIATLTEDVPFELEMIVENGRGYVPAAEQLALVHERGGEVGVIPVDAAFSPVVRVQYSVDEARVGQKTNYDKLTMKIWTDGSVAPDLALVEAAKIFRKHLNPFIQYDRLDALVFAKAKTSTGIVIDPIVESRLVLDVSELGLKERAVNCFKENNVKTVRDLVQLSEDSLRDFRNIGETSINEVKEKLAALGLRLGMRL